MRSNKKHVSGCICDNIYCIIWREGDFPKSGQHIMTAVQSSRLIKSTSHYCSLHFSMSYVHLLLLPSTASVIFWSWLILRLSSLTIKSSLNTNDCTGFRLSGSDWIFRVIQNRGRAATGLSAFPGTDYHCWAIRQT